MKKTLPDIAALVSELPDADRPGRESKFTGPPPEEARRIAAAIIAGGAESVTELAAMVRDAAGGGDENYKPGYALRCVGLQVAGEDRAKERAAFVAGIAAVLRFEELSAGAKGFLVRELEAAGADESVEALAGALAEESLRGDAVRALVAIGGTRAREALRKALGKTAGGSGARLALIHALGALADGDARDAFRAALGDDDSGVRLAAAWTLARTASGAEDGKRVVDAAKSAAGWERIQLLKSALLLAETLASSGDADGAEAVRARLREGDDPAEEYLRRAAGGA